MSSQGQNDPTMTNQTTQKLLLRVGEAAEILSVARSRAYAMVAAGEIPSVKLGRSVRVPVASLHAYIASLIKDAAEAR